MSRRGLHPPAKCGAQPAGFTAQHGLDQVPDLVLTSDTDNTVPNSLSDEMANGIPGAKLVVLADCGHLPQLEQPQACAEALVQWLRN